MDVPNAEPPGRLPDLPERATFHLMRRALQQHQTRWAERLPEVTKPQYAVLRAVAAEPGSDQATVGRRAAVDKATLVPLLGRLAERGLVRRTADETDRRRRHLDLTDAGRELLAQVAPVAEEVNLSMLGVLTETEQDVLRDLLGRLTRWASPS